MSRIQKEILTRDKKINELKEDKNKLKILLKKAKVAIDGLNLKIKATCDHANVVEAKLQLSQERNKDLESKVEQAR